MQQRQFRDEVNADGVIAEWRRTPVGTASITRDVAVPALTTVLSTLFVGVPSGILIHTVLAHSGIMMELVATIAGTGAIVMIIAWLYTLHLSIERGQIIEEIRYRDDVPQQVSRPVIPIEEERETPYGIALKRFDIVLPEGISDPDFISFCKTTLHTDDFSESTWCGAGGPFSRPAYGKLRHHLIQPSLGILEWKNQSNHAQGVQLTPRGRRVFSKLAAPPSPDAAISHKHEERV